MKPLVKIVRLEQTTKGVLGSLVLNGQLFCTTLEPDSNDPVKRQIPEGVYLCKKFHGSRFPNTFEIIVPGHTAVLFHPGNIEADTQMCILLGQYPGKLKGQRAILNSGNTFKEFMGFMGQRAAFELEIINFY